MEAPTSTALLPRISHQFINLTTPDTANPTTRQVDSPGQCALSGYALINSVLLGVLVTDHLMLATCRSVLMALTMLVFFGSANYSAAMVTIDYVYDDLNRLTGVARDVENPMVIYHYDEVSNIEWIASDNSPDTDADHTPNFVDPDDDNDGIPDAVEINAGLNPLKSADAHGDLDSDGISNISEYLMGSDINHFHGDLDSDGDLDLGDIVVLKRIMFDMETATQEQGESGHGDVNMDGSLDVGDLVILRRLYFGN